MQRSRWLVLLAASAVLALNCDDWHAYDDVFTRSSVAGSRGWNGGDGAVGIRLPGGSDRTLWIFGDSYTTEIDSSGTRLETGTFADVVFGNTIAVQDNSGSPDPGQIRFYGRSPVNQCITTPGPGTTCPVADITRLTPGNTSAFVQFFNHRMLNLTPGPTGAGALWPSGGVCLNCDSGTTADDRLLLSFVEIQFCNPSTEANCIPMCAFSGAPQQGPCTAGVRTLGNVIARIANPTAPLEQWTGTSMRVAGDVPWSSFLQDGNQLYIYGTRSSNLVFPDPTKLQSQVLVAARVPVANVLDQSQWTYWKNGSFVASTTPPAGSTLAKVAYVAGAVTVTKVVRRGITGYVLVNDNPFIDHFVYARVGSTPTSFPDVTTTTPRAEISAFDKSLRDQITLRPFFQQCPQPTTPNTYRTCALNYHATAHPHLAPVDGFGPSSLVFTYIIPQPLLPGMMSSIDVYRPKFGGLPLDNLSPWCTSAGQPCWAGIGFWYSTASVAQGANSQVFEYDVSKASRINVSLLYGTGDPDVYVKFGSPPTTSSWNCRPFSSSFPETCDLAVPSGQTRAYVMVRGFSAATYVMRVHYQGD